MKYVYKLTKPKEYYEVTVCYPNGTIKRRKKYNPQIGSDIFNRELKQSNKIVKNICEKYYKSITNVENYFIFKVLMGNFYFKNLKYNHKQDEYFYFENCGTVFIDALFYIKYKSKKFKRKGFINN